MHIDLNNNQILKKYKNIQKNKKKTFESSKKEYGYVYMINKDNSHIGNYFTDKTIPGPNVNPNAFPLSLNNVSSAASKYNINCNRGGIMDYFSFKEVKGNIGTQHK